MRTITAAYASATSGVEQRIAGGRAERDEQHLLHRAQVLLPALAERPHPDQERAEHRRGLAQHLEVLELRQVADRQAPHPNALNPVSIGAPGSGARRGRWRGR